MIMKFESEVPLPTYITVNVGSLCGYACIFCLNSRMKKEEHIHLSFSKLKEILPIFPENAIVDLSGYGEAMLRPDFSDIVRLVTDKKIGFTLSTSGEPLTEDLQNLLRQSTLQNINFSLNSLNPEIKKILSGGRGNFDLVMKHFKSFVTKPRKYLVSITMIVNRLNFREMPDFIRFGIEYGVERVGLHRLVGGIKYPENFTLLENEEELKFIEEANKIAKDNNMPISGLSTTPRKGIDYQIDKKPIKECTAPWTQTVISPGGVVVPCCLSSYVLGNINTSSFCKIWNGQKINELRDAIHNNDDKFCKGCIVYGR